MKKTALVAGAGATILVAAWALIRRRSPVGNASVSAPAKLVDVHRYLGRWYEQFRYEAWFQKGLEAVTADYSLNRDGTLRVVNHGRKGGLNGPPRRSVGTARIVDSATNAKLKVSFFGPFYGDYWVLNHGDDYDWAIVGEPAGRYMWALTRNAKPGLDMIAMLEARVARMGYNRDLIRFTQQ